MGCGGCFRKNWVGVGCFGIVELVCGWCCGVFHGKNWVGPGARVSNCKKTMGLCCGWGLWFTYNWVKLVIAVHGLVELGVLKPHFAHP